MSKLSTIIIHASIAMTVATNANAQTDADFEAAVLAASATAQTVTPQSDTDFEVAVSRVPRRETPPSGPLTPAGSRSQGGRTRNRDLAQAKPDLGRDKMPPPPGTLPAEWRTTPKNED